jgi:hypothetical protein
VAIAKTGVSDDIKNSCMHWTRIQNKNTMILI